MRNIQILILTMTLLLLCGCGQPAAETPGSTGYVGQTEMMVVIKDETVPLSQAMPAGPAGKALDSEAEALSQSTAAAANTLTPKASGIKEKRVSNAVIDYSHTEDGYVMVKYTGQTTKRLKSQVKGPSTTYTYNVTPGQWETFPLSDGNGKYQVALFENVSGNKYAAVTSVSFDVKLTNEFAPYLLPNQYVNYSTSSTAVEKARELTDGLTQPLEMVEVVYNFVVKELTYDNYKAATVQSGYIPVLDSVMEEKKGICFDYASLMTGMLRSQGIPCKMVFGYTNGAYHAWISVWTEDTGWLDGVIFFDGVAWQRMDPTFASSAGQSESIMQYIGNGTNYSEKYFY